jgi:hypothetical protein
LVLGVLVDYELAQSPTAPGHCRPQACPPPLPMPHSYPTFQERWAAWIARQPAVARYLDPVFVLFQPTATPPVPGLAPVIASLPTLRSGVAPVPVSAPQAAAAAAAAPAAPLSLYKVGSEAEAMAVGAAVRTHFADPLGGGGQGAALHIVSFATNGPLFWW